MLLDGFYKHKDRDESVYFYYEVFDTLYPKDIEEVNEIWFVKNDGGKDITYYSMDKYNEFYNFDSIKHGILDEIASINQQNLDRSNEESERREYERLKKKFEGSKNEF